MSGASPNLMEQKQPSQPSCRRPSGWLVHSKNEQNERDWLKDKFHWSNLLYLMCWVPSVSIIPHCYIKYQKTHLQFNELFVPCNFFWFKVPRAQCDQIWRKFATLEKLCMSLGIFLITPDCWLIPAYVVVGKLLKSYSTLWASPAWKHDRRKK